MSGEKGEKGYQRKYPEGAVETEISNLRKTQETLNKTIEILNQSDQIVTKQMTNLQTSRDETQKKARIRDGNISPEVRKDWFNNTLKKNNQSLFKTIQEIQETIKRLDNWWVLGGADKAQKIRTALGYAIDHVMQKTLDKGLNDFKVNEFLSYNKPALSILGNPSQSLKEALSIHRHKWLDEKRGKEEPESANIFRPK